jgi:hypothetical protein
MPTQKKGSAISKSSSGKSTKKSQLNIEKITPSVVQSENNNTIQNSQVSINRVQ